MKEHMNLVTKFLQKQEMPIHRNLQEEKVSIDEQNMLNDISTNLILLSKKIEDRMKIEEVSPRLHQVYLHLEELSELVEALASLDEVALLDALADLQFITMGTAVTFTMPLEDAHFEVCKSNLTKNLRSDQRVRDKGPNYVPPNLKDVLISNHYIMLVAQRTESQNFEISKDVTVTFQIGPFGGTKNYGVFCIEGGVTGYESICIEDLMKPKGGWYMCAGTEGHWDELFLPEDQVKRLQEWATEVLERYGVK